MVLSILYINKAGRMNTIKHMDFWFEKPPGSFIIEQELALLDELLPLMTGDVLLQIGGPSHLKLVDRSSITHKIYCSIDGAATLDVPTFEADVNQLPLQQSCLDCVVMIHTLAYAKNPRQVLEKLAWSMKPGAKLVLFGFNKHSLWGFAKISRDKTRFPWGGEFHPPGRVKKWVADVGLQLIAEKQICFRGPAVDRKKWQRFRFLEVLGSTLLPAFSGVYMLYVQKEALGMTPSNSAKKVKQKDFNGQVEPTMRQYHKVRGPYEKN
jgi:SAM-dependent methyltransferase